MDEVGIEQRAPRFALLIPWWEEALRDFHAHEFEGVRLGAVQRLAFAELLDQAADERAFRAVQTRFDPWVVANGDVRRLHRAQRAVAVLTDVHVAVVNVATHTLA